MDKKFTGYCEPDTLPIKKGDTVTILKGVEIRSLHPQRDTRPSGRTYKVKVDHVLAGTTHPGSVQKNPSVRWPGTGGYWNEVDINDIPEAADNE